jgi:hypothetical protein
MGGFYTHEKMRGRSPTSFLDVQSTGSGLWFSGAATTEKIFERAKKLGLELCPPETGPLYRLANTEQPLGDWCYIAMERITGSADSGGKPRVFYVGRREDGLWLYGDWVEPDSEWGPRHSFLFRLRTSNP